MDGKISNFMQVASVRRYEMTEGQQRGLRVLDCDNGKLRFLLNESKALDVMQLFHKGQNMSFVSKNGYMFRELPFLNRFEGGMLYTCGVDNVGPSDRFEMHGSHHNAPVRVTKAECSEEGITVEAEMTDAALFGKHLVFKRRVFSAIGSDTLEITDTLENRAYRDEEYCLLYHVNIGYPMLDEGAKVIGEVKSVTPRTEWAAQHANVRESISDSVPNEFETCYFIKVKKPEFSLVNEKIGKKFTLAWSGDTLPCFLQWKSMQSGDYALGFEPSTTELDDQFAYSRIAAGETIGFRLVMRIEEL